MKSAVAFGIFLFVVGFVTAIEVAMRLRNRLLLIALMIAILCLSIYAARARDLGQWQNSDATQREWYQKLMQPDNPAVPCCGEADAYWADSYEVDGDKYVAIITDPRPDEPLRRHHVDIGTKIVIPNHKLKYDQSNPTGHGIVFLSQNDFVWCYLAPGGV